MTRLFRPVRYPQRPTTTTDIETMNPLVAFSHDHVVERPLTASSRGGAWHVERSSRQNWLRATVLGTAVGGGLFYLPAFFFGAPLAAAVALPIAAAISSLIRFGTAGTGSRTQRVMYSVLCGAVTGPLCVFRLFGGDIFNGFYASAMAWAMALGGICAGISSLLFGCRLQKKCVMNSVDAENSLGLTPVEVMTDRHDRRLVAYTIAVAAGCSIVVVAGLFQTLAGFRKPAAIPELFAAGCVWAAVGIVLTQLVAAVLGVRYSVSGSLLRMVLVALCGFSTGVFLAFGPMGFIAGATFIAGAIGGCAVADVVFTDSRHRLSQDAPGS